MSALDDVIATNAAPAAASPLDAVIAANAGSAAAPAAAAPASTPFVTQVGQMLNDVPRQLGLTARDALEGGGQAAQIISEPIRYATDRLLGTTGKTAPAGVLAERAADWMGLPKPANATERVVNEGAKLGFGAIGGGAAARLADTATSVAAPVVQPLIGRIGAALSANPVAAVSSAAGSGAAGQASKEAGGTPGEQIASAVLGGVAAPYAAGAVQRTGGAVSSLLESLKPKPSTSTIETAFTQAVDRAGINLGAMAPAARLQLRQDYREALNTGGQVSDEALSRLASMRSSGITPTRGMVSQDPVQITQEQNLAKLAANSSTGGTLHGLPRLQNDNNRALIGTLNTLGAGTETQPLTAGRAVLGGIVSRNSALETAEQAAWDVAKAHPGYTLPIHNNGLNAINTALGESGQMPFMAPGISKYMEAFQTGQQPFTPQAYRNLRSMLSGELSKGGNEAAAAQTAIRALDSAPIRPLTETGRDIGMAPVTQGLAGALRGQDAQAGEAIDLVNKARAATAQKYAYQESSPLVRTALSDKRTADPEHLAKSFVLGGTVNDARHVADAVGPDGTRQIRDALATHIKKAALSGADDETGKVGQKNLKQALDQIGDEKLGLFFSPEEVAQLRNVSRAASLMQSQPSGAAVNNSNSGALVMGKALDFLDSKVLRYLPGSDYLPGLVTAPLRNANLSFAQRGVQNVGPALLQPSAAGVAPTPGLLLPATLGVGLGAAGLLAAPK